jgi:hypothetical protein
VRSCWASGGDGSPIKAFGAAPGEGGGRWRETPRSRQGLRSMTSGASVNAKGTRLGFSGEHWLEAREHRRAHWGRPYEEQNCGFETSDNDRTEGSARPRR